MSADTNNAENGDGAANATAVKANTAKTDSHKFAGKTLQDYEVLSVMGNGAFGTCYKVRDKNTGELYAWKGMNYDELLDESKCESLISEISMLRQLRHPNIVQYYHHLINREAKSIYLVMECCAGGDLAQLIRRARAQRQRFEESYIWRVLFQLCRALQVCHNKIPAGTILHRDIKPANIFLDEHGNAKLGDFGLARMLRRDQCFAASFVGTPHYMSPELIKGRQYDRKSDVWAVGCLIYELCALRPPFKGRAFEQLSANIASGQFVSIPAVYSADLQAIITFMLAVDHEQRPGIEVITRHPLVVRNLNTGELSASQFPSLLPVEENFYMPTAAGKLFEDCDLSPNSSLCTDRHSFNEGYGQRRLSITGVFTPELRNELFYSAKRRIFAASTRAKAKHLQQSDPALYESIRREQTAQDSPSLVTQHVFDEALQTRLHAIRAQEALLQQRAAEMQARADELQRAEQRVQALEAALQEKLRHCQCQTVAASPPPPPVPPRKPPTTRHDDTYCSIELSETSPTVAKLDLAALQAPKSLKQQHALRRVTFKSPRQEIENVPPSVPMQTSVSSKGSSTTEDSREGHVRRKSILSLFGLSRHTKAAAKSTIGQQQQPPPQLRNPNVPLTIKLPTQQQQQQQQQQAQLASIWTKEQKRAAFDLLAAMNAAEKGSAGNASSGTGSVVGGRSKQQLRQSMRDRSATMQRSRLRRSLVVTGAQQRQSLMASRDQILI